MHRHEKNVFYLDLKMSKFKCETYQTAEFIHYFLNPLSVKHPSHLKDTYHFISIIKDLDIPTD